MFDLNGDGEVDYQEFQKVLYITHLHLQVEYIIVNNLITIYICSNF